MNTSSSIAFYPNESRATFPWTRTSEEEIEEIEEIEDDDDEDEDEDDNVDEEEEEELEEEPRILRKKKAKNEIEEEEKNEKEGTPLSPVNHITSSSSILVPSYESVLPNEFTEDLKSQLTHEILHIQQERKSLRDTFLAQRELYFQALKTQHQLRVDLSASGLECEKLESEIQCLVDLIIESQTEEQSAVSFLNQ